MITSPTQQHLIFQLEALRKKISETNDRKLVFSIAQQAYDLVLPIPIDPHFGYKIEGKTRTLAILEHEIRSYEKSNVEIEVIKFQISSSILMLLLQFMQGTLEEMIDVVQEYVKVA